MDNQQKLFTHAALPPPLTPKVSTPRSRGACGHTNWIETQSYISSVQFTNFQYLIYRVQCRLDFGCMKQASALCVVIWLPEEKKEMRDRETQMPPKYYHAQDFLATHFSISQEKFYSMSMYTFLQ